MSFQHLLQSRRPSCKSLNSNQQIKTPYQNLSLQTLESVSASAEEIKTGGGELTGEDDVLVVSEDYASVEGETGKDISESDLTSDPDT